MCSRLETLSFVMIMLSLLSGRTGSFCAITSRIARSRLSSRMDVLSDTISSHSQSSGNMVLEPLVVCGPSGVGKGTIIQKFMEELSGQEHFQFSVSHTTRSPRPGEIDGIHYHFVNLEMMKQGIKLGEFLEHAEVHGNYYGTSWQSLRDVQNAGKRCLLDIDVQGVKNIKRMESDTMKPRYVFISPPSLEVLQERLVGRGTESPESLARRSANAQTEMHYGLEKGNFDVVVVNSDLDQACWEFATVVREMYDL